MGLLDKLFGRTPQAVSHEASERAPLSLQVLFAQQPKLDTASATQALRRYHASLSEATFDVQQLENRGLAAQAVWADHKVDVVGIDAPMPTEVVDSCVQPAHYDQSLKEQARQHAAHTLLYYSGQNSEPLEQYVALAVVAGTLSSYGATVILNEAAHTSFPAKALVAGKADGDSLGNLRTLPLLFLYCGFVKYEVDGTRGVWMRTYGAHLFGQPDLAMLAEGHGQAEEVFGMFSSILDYLRNSGARFENGHTMELGEGLWFTLRAPKPNEYFLESEGQVFVLERTTPRH
jgi:hypothetical protein